MKKDFDVEPLDHLPLEESVRWWDSEETVEWFSQRGYQLYKGKFDGGDPCTTVTPQYPTAERNGDDQDPYPYPYIHGSEIATCVSLNGKMAYAQDKENRHVAIKFIRVDSDEHRILEFLKQQDPSVIKDACIIPVFDILVFDHRYAFVIMPRWGIALGKDDIISVGQVLKLMHSILKALKFLHDHRIVHHDARFANVLINYFTAEFGFFYRDREKMREANRLRYALCDFDISIKYDADTDLKACRLPSSESFDCVPLDQLPSDVKQGELYYNPFAYDIAFLAMSIFLNYQHIIPKIPHLAPLFDRMVTYNISQRFTAMEALRFFEENCLAKYESKFVEPVGRRFSSNDLWEGVPPSFVEEWSSYRTPPLPFKSKLLSWLCTYRIGYFGAVNVRKLIRRFSRLRCLA